MKKSATLFCAAMTGCLVGVAQPPVAAVAYISPDSPENTRQIDYRYDRFNRIISAKTTYPISPGKYESGRYVYTDYKPGLYDKFQEYRKGLDGNEEVLTKYGCRLYDGNDNVVVEAYYNSPTNVFWANLYDYSVLPQGVYVGTANYNYDPSTYELLDSTNTKLSAAYCHGAKRYFDLDVRNVKMTVYDDHTVTEHYDNQNPDKITSISWSYYADGKTLYTLEKNFREPYDNPDDFYWNGYRQDVSETEDVKTTIDYNIDETSGEFVYSKKTEQSTGEDGPMHNSFTRVYYWQDNQWIQNPQESYEYTWLNKNVRKTINSNKETLTFFDDNGNASGTLHWVGNNLYMTATENVEENTWYYNYYTLEGKLLRQIKADYTYIWMPRFYEYLYGEWRFPTQGFVYYKGVNYGKDRGVYKVSEVYPNTGFPKGMTYGKLEGGIFTGYGKIYIYCPDGFPISWTREFDNVSGFDKYDGEGSVKLIADGVYGISYWNEFRDKYKPIYFEYDVKRGLKNFYKEEANGQRVYAYTEFIRQMNGRYFHNDTLVVIRSTYDYNTDVMTMTRQECDEYNGTFDFKYAYDFEKEEWVKTSEMHKNKTIRPEWKKCTEPETPWTGVPYKTTGLTYSEANKILRGASANSKPEEDTDKLTLTFDPATGEVISREHQYVVYEDTPQTCARHAINEKADGTVTTDSEVYELTADGRPCHYYRSWESTSAPDENYTSFERWWEYDVDGNVTQISGSNMTTTRYAYGQSYDLINDYESGIHEVEATMVGNSTAPVKYFNLQGIEIPDPQGGIFIRCQGNRTTKELIP